MANLTIGGNVSAGRDINIAQEGSQISNKYNDTIKEELDKHQELTDVVTMIQSQLQMMLENTTQEDIKDNSIASSFISNLKKIGAKSIDLATAVVGDVLQNITQKYI